MEAFKMSEEEINDDLDLWLKIAKKEDFEILRTDVIDEDL